MGHVGNKQALRLLSYDHRISSDWVQIASTQLANCFSFIAILVLHVRVSIQILIIFSSWISDVPIYCTFVKTKQAVNYFGFSPQTPWEPVAARMFRCSSLSCPFPTMAFNKPNITCPFLSPRLIFLFTPALINAMFAVEFRFSAIFWFLN